MDPLLLERIRSKAIQQTQNLLPVATEQELLHVENTLGLQIHPLLRELYAKVGNGGFGPGWLLPTAPSDQSVGSFQDIISTCEILTNSFETTHGEEWPDGLVPFFDYGCREFGLVDCSSGQMYLFYDDDEIEEEDWTIAEYFQRWVDGTLNRSIDESEVIRVQGINPFTGEAAEYRARKKEQ